MRSFKQLSATMLKDSTVGQCPVHPAGSIPFWRIALRLEVWGYTNKVRLAHILHHRQKPGLLRICKAETINLSFINPVSLTLLRMVQDIS